jgi:hypothetical protein
MKGFCRWFPPWLSSCLRFLVQGIAGPSQAQDKPEAGATGAPTTRLAQAASQGENVYKWRN